MTNSSSEAPSNTTAIPMRTGRGRNWLKGIALVVWVVLIAAYWRYTTVNDLSPLQTVRQLVSFLATSTLGVVVYTLLYVIRPAVFFPATLLTLAGGYLYGPIGGTLVVVIASNLSSLVAYAIGRFFGTGMAGNDATDDGATDDGATDDTEVEAEMGVLQRYAARLRRNSFETVLTMRFLFLPYDLVSYFAGLLRVNWQAFLLATALGSIPGTLSFVFFGASIEGDFTGELPTLNATTLVVAALMFAVSIALSRWFKRRERHHAQPE